MKYWRMWVRRRPRRTKTVRAALRVVLPKFGRAGRERGSGDQFSFRLKKDGGLYANSTDPVTAADFNALLDGVEQQLVTMGNAIFAGDISVNPYRHANKTPCEYCDYAA